MSLSDIYPWRTLNNRCPKCGCTPLMSIVRFKKKWRFLWWKRPDRMRHECMNCGFTEETEA